jgi:hypothetical protein
MDVGRVAAGNSIGAALQLVHSLPAQKEEDVEVCALRAVRLEMLLCCGFLPNPGFAGSGRFLHPSDNSLSSQLTLVQCALFPGLLMVLRESVLHFGFSWGWGWGWGWGEDSE